MLARLAKLLRPRQQAPAQPLPPHYIGAKWPREVIRVRIEPSPFEGEIREAIGNWNAVTRPFGVRIVAGARTRNHRIPARRDGESTIYLSPATPNFADVDVSRRGSTIIEADMRISEQRMAPLTGSRRRIIIEHEVGHMLGFGHHDGPEDSIMHSRLPLRIAGITDFDRAAVAAVYSRK